MNTIDISPYVSFVVTGVLVNGKRFTDKYSAESYRTVFGINLYRGHVWGVLPNGKRQKLKSVWN